MTERMFKRFYESKELCDKFIEAAFENWESEFLQMGYKMVIWPVSSLRVANKAQAKLYAAIAKDGGTHNMVEEMQTRAELYDVIGLHDYEALDASIVKTIVPEAIPQV